MYSTTPKLNKPKHRKESMKILLISDVHFVEFNPMLETLLKQSKLKMFRAGFLKRMEVIGMVSLTYEVELNLKIIKVALLL